MTGVDEQEPRGQSESAPIHPWRAIGRAEEDLPGWLLRRRGWSFASVTIEVGQSSGSCLEQAARSVFTTALGQLRTPPVRVWAFLPRITDGDTGGMDRYMCMNRGRGAAYRHAELPFIPAGTCTGHAGTALVVHAMSSSEPMTTVENPRQRPAWDYSARFGPHPPPFTRGVVGSGVLVASGTASVVGEESCHVDDPEAQWAETMRNLSALSSAAGAAGAWHAVRVYVARADCAPMMRRLAVESFGCAVDSVVLAPLCRRDLAVEVEGVRDL